MSKKLKAVSNGQWVKAKTLPYYALNLMKREPNHKYDVRNREVVYNPF
jgi:hypothetical protein